MTDTPRPESIEDFYGGPHPHIESPAAEKPAREITFGQWNGMRDSRHVFPHQEGYRYDAPLLTRPKDWDQTEAPEVTRIREAIDAKLLQGKPVFGGPTAYNKYQLEDALVSQGAGLFLESVLSHSDEDGSAGEFNDWGVAAEPSAQGVRVLLSPDRFRLKPTAPQIPTTV